MPIYFPGNGGLLTAAAMMAAGWDSLGSSGATNGAPTTHTPELPKDGKWVVKWQGLKGMP